MAGGSNFAAEFNWNTNISQNVQTVAVMKKYMDSPKKWIHFEMTEGWNFAVECDWNWQFSQNVQSFFLLFRKKIRFSEKLWIFLKRLKVSISLLNENQIVRFLKTFKICFFYWKEMGFSRKDLESFCKDAKGSKLAASRLK